MDQVYRIGRRLGKLMLALLMVVSLFDLTSLFANDETNAPAKVIQLCDEENIQSSEDGELDRKSTRLNSSHLKLSRMPSSA